MPSDEEKLDALIINQQTLASEVHEVLQRIGDLERWREVQEGMRRVTTMSLAENDVRDQVFRNTMGLLEEKIESVQRSMDAYTVAQAEAAKTNRAQTEVVQAMSSNLAISSSMAPVVAKLRSRLPAYVAIAALIGAIVAAFVHALIRGLKQE